MKIIKKGTKKLKEYEFKCTKCNTEFIANEGEVKPGYDPRTPSDSWVSANCPECKEFNMKTTDKKTTVTVGDIFECDELHKELISKLTHVKVTNISERYVDFELCTKDGELLIKRAISTDTLGMFINDNYPFGLKKVNT